MSDRTSVAALPAEGLIRLRTPEGQEIHVTIERACEWLSDCAFRDRLKRACNEMPATFKVVEVADGGGI